MRLSTAMTPRVINCAHDLPQHVALPRIAGPSSHSRNCCAATASAWTSRTSVRKGRRSTSASRERSRRSRSRPRERSWPTTPASSSRRRGLASVHVLLNTCALLWLVGDPARLSASSARARAALESTEAEAYVSAISGFEISVKHRKGKLELPLPPREWLAQAFEAYSLWELPITLQIAALALEVAVAHADPCDRMIVATPAS